MAWREDWTSIRSDSPNAGLANLISDFEIEKANASTALDLVAANLWLGQYAEAERVCREAEAARTENMSASCFPIQRGIAQWCLGRFYDAKCSWESVVGVKYADTNGANIHYLLLLAADGLVHGAVPTLVRSAIEEKRIDSRVHRSWPGPIALYLHGVYGASMVVKEGGNDPVNRWQFEFYQALKSFSLRKNTAELATELAALFSSVKHEADLRTFVDFARLPEVYLARAVAAASAKRA